MSIVQYRQHTDYPDQSATSTTVLLTTIAAMIPRLTAMKINGLNRPQELDIQVENK